LSSEAPTGKAGRTYASHDAQHGEQDDDEGKKSCALEEDV
jgi:hypothetical protein